MRNLIRNNEKMEFLDYYVSENVDKINPINFIKQGIVQFKISEIKEKLFTKNPILMLGVEDSFYQEKANEFWKKYHTHLLSIKISDNFKRILSDNNLSKQEQENTLKGEVISPIEMQSLFIQAYNNFNYSYSHYHFDFVNTKKENYKLPNIFNYSNNKLTKIGETNLTDSELKQMINQRNSVIVHFLDNGEHWHCLFMTYRSLSGKETWKDEKSHYHYLSDKWNIKRDDAINQFNSKKYPSTKVHIICKR